MENKKIDWFECENGWTTYTYAQIERMFSGLEIEDIEKIDKIYELYKPEEIRVVFKNGKEVYYTDTFGTYASPTVFK